MMRSNRLFYAVAAGVLLAQTGCVAYRDSELPAKPSGEAVAAPACSSASTRAVIRRDGLFGEVDIVSPSEAEHAQAAADSSGLVSKDGPKGRELQISVLDDEQGNLFLSFLCGLTLTLSPSYVDKEITVTGRILDHGEVVATAEARSTVTRVTELFLLFAMPWNDNAIMEETIKALTRKVCADLSPPVPAKEAPPAPGSEGAPVPEREATPSR